MSSKSTEVFGLVLLSVADVVEEDQLAAVEPGQRLLEGEVAPGSLELLHQIGGAAVEDAAAGFDERAADGAKQMIAYRERKRIMGSYGRPDPVHRRDARTVSGTV